MKIEYFLPQPGRYDWNGSIDRVDGVTYSELKYTGAGRAS
jgi:hypothetical protein